jgi:hypothetical protein
MLHICEQACECRKDLDAAAAALEGSARMPSAFISGGSMEAVEKYYAAVRACEMKLKGAMLAYRDQLAEL